MLSFVILILMHVGTVAENSDLTDECPTPSDIAEKAKHFGCIFPKEYHDIWDISQNVFAERCFVSKLVPKGEMIVLDSISNQVNSMECPGETFHPEAYQSSSHSCCLVKSKCNEKGLVISSNGNTSEDRRCVCDYTLSYAPKSTLLKGCFCQPRKEICKCKLVDCGRGSKLTPDYKCIKEEDYKRTYFKCPDILKDNISRQKTTAISTESIEQTTRKTSTEIENETKDDTDNLDSKSGLITGIVLACIICMMCSFVVGIFLEKKKQISDKISGYVFAVLPSCNKDNCCPLTCVTSEVPTNSTNSVDQKTDEGLDAEETSLISKEIPESSLKKENDQVDQETDEGLDTEETSLISKESPESSLKKENDQADQETDEGLDTEETSLISKESRESSGKKEKDQECTDADIGEELQREEGVVFIGHHTENDDDDDDDDDEDDGKVIILCTQEDKEQAGKYCEHLNKLKVEFNMESIKIRLLPIDDAMSPKFEKILKSCCHIFIFVTQNFSMETFKREVDFDHLREKYFEDHFNIDRVKVVCADTKNIPEELCTLNIIQFCNMENATQAYYNRIKYYFYKAQAIL